MKKIIIGFLLLSTNLWAQKISFGPIFTIYNEKSFGNERVNNQYSVEYCDDQVKEKPKFGAFLDYKLSKNISTTVNLQFSKPSNEITVFGFGTDDGQTKVLSFTDNRLNSELLINYKLFELNKSKKIILVTGIDYNRILSIQNNLVEFTNPIDFEYGEIINLAGNSFKKNYLRYVFGIKAEYKKIIIGINYNSKIGGSITNSFLFRNSNYYNYSTNRAINFSIGYKIRESRW